MASTRAVNIRQGGLIGVFFEMLPAPGFKEQAGPKVSQGLLEFLIRFMKDDALPGNFAAFFNRATIFVTVKGMGKGKNVLPSGAPGGNIFFNQ